MALPLSKFRIENEPEFLAVWLGWAKSNIYARREHGLSWGSLVSQAAGEEIIAIGKRLSSVLNRPTKGAPPAHAGRAYGLVVVHSYSALVSLATIQYQTRRRVWTEGNFLARPVLE